MRYDQLCTYQRTVWKLQEVKHHHVGIGDFIRTEVYFHLEKLKKLEKLEKLKKLKKLKPNAFVDLKLDINHQSYWL